MSKTALKSSRNLCARRSACRWLSKWIASHQWRRLIDLYKTSGFIYTSNDWIKGVHAYLCCRLLFGPRIAAEKQFIILCQAPSTETDGETDWAEWVSASERARVREKKRESESERGDVERHHHPYTGLLYWSYADWNCTGAVLFHLNYNAITCEGDCWIPFLDWRAIVTGDARDAFHYPARLSARIIFQYISAVYKHHFLITCPPRLRFLLAHICLELRARIALLSASERASAPRVGAFDVTARHSARARASRV